MSEEQPSTTSFLILAVGVEGGLGLLAVLLGWALDTHPFERHAWLDGRAALIGVVGTLPMLLLLPIFVNSQWPPFARIREMVEETLLPLVSRCSTGELLGVALLAGLGEEMMFRGVIQGYLEGLHGPFLAVFIASILFGLAHYLTTAYFVLATAIGAYLSLLWAFADNLLAPMIAHALYDFVALIVLVRRHRRIERS